MPTPGAELSSFTRSLNTSYIRGNADTQFCAVHAAKMEQFNPRSEGLCMQIGQSTGSFLSDALTMQPGQCSALNIGAGRHSQGAGGRGQESAPGWIVPAGLYPRQGGERRPAMGDK